MSEDNGTDARTFERTALRKTLFKDADLSGSRFERVNLTGVVMRGVELGDATIDGAVWNVTINGVDVGPLIEAELDRRDPDRVKMRPTTPAGFRDAWSLLEMLWSGTVTRARTLPPELLHASVDNEWSFTETLRHLVFATDAWIHRVILGDPHPWDPLDLPFDEMPDAPGIPRDRDVRPSLDEVLALRRDRWSTVRQFLDTLTEQQLDSHTTPVTAPGWPAPESYPVRDCLLIVLNEEYQHRLYAERDLAALMSAS
ncbi:pentapeptide repeat protein [Kribbella flavida DSM 17836]|uniref:Pentapeptide repeat protein n=1 Tax=Kribbella flavida (strain DSM 17836 / JCM 10339 / NBRC 14399) TaxID=479435 RepID=D2PP70_KRIFD|nr:DinB family protein [Kribbella flavida]ADB34666.1 pentapeptide repeat protein [Kribbella flavida DSM 17836]